MLENNISKILIDKGVTINDLSKNLGFYYCTIHKLVKRQNLSDTKLVNLVLIADFLQVDITDLYIKK